MDKKKIKIPDPLKKYVIQDIDKVFVKKDSIAKGGQGTVWLAVDNQKKLYAIKEILVDLNNPISQIKRYLIECAALMRAQHPFIVTFRGMTDEYPFQMITEYVGPVNLTIFLTDRHFKSQSNNGTHLTKIAIAISNAMMFLHKIDIIHRDLKPSNILIGNDFLPRICDFGLVHEVDQKSLMTAELGTPIWMAPEVIRGENYSEKCDVFSFSMILYQMATKVLPLAELNPTIIMEKYKNEHYRPFFPEDSKIPKPLQDLIISCWNENPEERPSFQQIFDKFANGDVFFPHCNFNLIKQFTKKLIKDDQNRPIIPPFEIFTYKSPDDQSISNSDKKNQKKNDINKKLKKTVKKNSEEDDSKSDTDSSDHQSKKKKKIKKADNSSEDSSSDSYVKNTKKKKKKRIIKKIKSDNTTENHPPKKKKIIKKIESDDSTDSTESYKLKTKTNKSKRVESDDSTESTESYQLKKKVKRSKRIESDDSTESYQLKTKTNKSKRVESDDSTDSTESYPLKKKTNKPKRIESDDSTDSYRLSTKGAKKKPIKNNNKKENESDTLYKNRRYSDNRIKYNKPAPIFEIDTFVTENKQRGKTQSKSRYRSFTKSSDYSDFSDDITNKPPSKMPQFRTHLTNDRKRKQAPDLHFTELTESLSEKSSESYGENERRNSANSKFYPIQSPRLTSNMPVSIETLNDVKNPMFRIELEKVKKRDFSKFIKILKNHLTSNTPQEELILLLRKMNELIEDDDCLALFSEKKVFEFLPISYENNRNGKNKNSRKNKYEDISESYSDEIRVSKHDELLDISIEILNRVCQFYPQFIDEDFESSMISLINVRPIEAAKFLRLYSVSFETLENPWPLLDMLIVHKKKFNKTDSGSILIKTLVNLIQTQKNYKKSRISNCRSVITYFLNSPIKKNVIAAYKALAVLYDNKFDLPFKKIRIDLDDKELFEYVVSLFDKMDYIPSTKSIIFSLIKIAHKDEKAGDVLIKMAKDYQSASILINSMNFWMIEKLPTFEETLRIAMAAISKFRDLKRIVISDSIYFAELLSSLSKFEINDISFLCFEKVFSKIQFNFDFLENLHEKRFFTYFFRGFIEIEDNRVTLSCLRALKSLIEIGICDDFFNFSKTLRKFANRDDKIGDEAQNCIDMMNSSRKKKRKT